MTNDVIIGAKYIDEEAQEIKGIKNSKVVTVYAADTKSVYYNYDYPFGDYDENGIPRTCSRYSGICPLNIFKQEFTKI